MQTYSAESRSHVLVEQVGEAGSHTHEVPPQPICSVSSCDEKS